MSIGNAYLLEQYLLLIEINMSLRRTSFLNINELSINIFIFFEVMDFLQKSLITWEVCDFLQQSLTSYKYDWFPAISLISDKYKGNMHCWKMKTEMTPSRKDFLPMSDVFVEKGTKSIHPKPFYKFSSDFGISRRNVFK